TYAYDQQSATESTGGGFSTIIQSNQPIGQSFTPTFSSVGFIRLATRDPFFNGVDATPSVNLLSGSIVGPVLGTADPVSLPDTFAGYVDFIFPTPVSVTCPSGRCTPCGWTWISSFQHRYR